MSDSDSYHAQRPQHSDGLQHAAHTVLRLQRRHTHGPHGMGRCAEQQPQGPQQHDVLGVA